MKYSIDIETPLSIDDFVLFNYDPDPSQYIGAMYIGKVLNIDYKQVESERDEDKIMQDFTYTKIELTYHVRGFCIEDLDNYEKNYGHRPNKNIVVQIGYKNLITKLNPDVTAILYNQELYDKVKDQISEKDKSDTVKDYYSI